MRILIIMMICLLPIVSGCATVTEGTSQKVPVTSKPSGANVNVDGKENYTTPVTLKLSRRTDHVLKITMAGFKTHVFKLVRELNPLMVAEFAVPGGSVLAGVDVVDGAGLTLKPEKVDVILQEGEGEIIIGEKPKEIIEQKKSNTVYSFGHR